MRAAERVQLAPLRHLFHLVGYGRIVAHLRNFIFDLRKNNSRWVGLRVTVADIQGGRFIELERSLPIEVAEMSSFVDKLMLLVAKCRCVPESQKDVEIAWREAHLNAIIHGNYAELPAAPAPTDAAHHEKSCS